MIKRSIIEYCKCDPEDRDVYKDGTQWGCMTCGKEVEYDPPDADYEPDEGDFKSSESKTP